MRILALTLLGLPLLFLDGILLYTFPARAAGFGAPREGLIVAGGAALYICFHVFLRKPERLYLWAHEFSHLAAAKLFFRRIHSFHISSRQGGKVVVDRTNVMIDLAPYVIPFYPVAAGIVASVFRGVSPWIPPIYLGAASFLYAMHLSFSMESFLDGQPDLTRSGRLFSAAVVILFLLLWVPVLAAPGTAAGWSGAWAAYGDWLRDAPVAAFRLLDFGLSLIRP
jgi:hypothetical protein